MNWEKIINTKAFQDLLNQGKLPPVEMKIQVDTIIIISVAVITVTTIVFLISKAIK